MTATPVRRKVDALLKLAGGASNRAAADAAGVSPGTIARWRTDRVFAAELVELRAVVARRPLDADAVMARLGQAERRLTPGPVVSEGGGFRVQVSIPPGSSPRRVEQLTARAIARGLRAVRAAES
jgi:hypothetical protein